mmetsp:Transcript_12326/g.31118  ORF Transcript_12326/g.31118 Transcript_12326/m.31118 type:complete len:197 (-) Transcript_12326:287-877(-)
MAFVTRAASRRPAGTTAATAMRMAAARTRSARRVVGTNGSAMACVTTPALCASAAGTTATAPRRCVSSGTWPPLRSPRAALTMTPCRSFRRLRIHRSILRADLRRRARAYLRRTMTVRVDGGDGEPEETTIYEVRPVYTADGANARLEMLEIVDTSTGFTVTSKMLGIPVIDRALDRIERSAPAANAAAQAAYDLL